MDEDLDLLLLTAEEFHGHLGPFLILGLRAGLRAVKIFGRKPLSMKAIVKLERRVPYTCFLDGIQLVTGCTLGKQNIEVMEGDGIQALFILEGKRLQIEVRREVIELAERAEDQRGMALRFMKADAGELFKEKII